MRTLRNKSWFSLVELLIAMTLLGFLIWGIVHFVSGWIRVAQKTGGEMEKTESDLTIESNLLKLSVFPTPRADDGITPTSGASGAIFDADGSLMFIWTKTQTGYCANNPSLPLDFLRMRNDAGSSSWETREVGPYKIGDSGYSVYSGSTRIVGTGTRGGAKGGALNTELAGATSLALSGTTLAIADPGNDRIVYYGTTDSSLVFLEARNSGILEPESLEFSPDGLYVGARNGTFRILDWGGTGSILNSDIWPINTALTISGFRVTFGHTSALLSPSTTAQVTLSKNEGAWWTDITTIDDTITPSWSGFTWTFSGWTKVLNSGTELQLHVQDISPMPSSAWHSIATLSLLDWGWVPLLSKQLPYVTVWDKSISSNFGNVIEQISQESRARKLSGWISTFIGSIRIDDFLERDGTELTTSYPIRDFNITENWTHTILSYIQYLSYDCLDGTHVGRKQVWIFRKK